MGKGLCFPLFGYSKFEVRIFSEFFEFLQITAVSVITWDWNFTWMALSTWLRFSLFGYPKKEVWIFPNFSKFLLISGYWNFTWMILRPWPRFSLQVANFLKTIFVNFFCFGYILNIIRPNLYNYTKILIESLSKILIKNSYLIKRVFVKVNYCCRYTARAVWSQRIGSLGPRTGPLPTPEGRAVAAKRPKRVY